MFKVFIPTVKYNGVGYTAPTVPVVLHGICINGDTNDNNGVITTDGNNPDIGDPAVSVWAYQTEAGFGYDPQPIASEGPLSNYHPSPYKIGDPTYGCDSSGNITIHINTLQFNNAQSASDNGDFETALVYVHKECSIVPLCVPGTDAWGGPDLVGSGEKSFTVSTDSNAFIDFDDSDSQPSAFALQDAAYGQNAAQHQVQTNYKFDFRPSCDSLGPDGLTNNTIQIRWAQVNYNNPQIQPDHNISWELRDVTFGDNGQPIKINGGPNNNKPAEVQGNNLDLLSTYDVGYLQANHTYRWYWSGVDRSNGIQFWLPFSEVGALVTCAKPVDPTGSIQAVDKQCTEMELYAFDDILFNQNGSVTDPTNPNYNSVDWQVWNVNQPDNGFVTYDFGSRNRDDTGSGGLPTVNQSAANNAHWFTSAIIKSRLHTLLPYPTGAVFYLRVKDPTDGSWYWVNGALSPSPTYIAGADINPARTPSPDFAFHFQESCTSPEIQTATCIQLSTIDSSSETYYLRFTDTGAGGGTATQGPFNQSLSWDPFSQQPSSLFSLGSPLFPHEHYNVDMLTAPGGSVIDSMGINNGNSCMDVSCVPLTQAEAVEPGEPFSGAFGIQLTNHTSKTLSSSASGEYSVSVASGSGGLSVNSSPLSETQTLPSKDTQGGIVTMDGPWNFTAKYTGKVTADLEFTWIPTLGGPNNSNIDSYYTNLPCRSSYTPQTRPFVDVKNGDISAGGGFESKNSTQQIVCSATAAAGFIGPSTTNSNYAGGIRTFASSPPYGSSSDFAAFALGLIDGTDGSAGKYGFYTDGAQGSPSELAFANPSGGITPSLVTGGDGSIGGVFAGEGSASSPKTCTTDYYDTAMQASATALPSDDVGSFGAGQHQYTVAPSGCENLYGTVPAGSSVTIFVKGDVCLGSIGTATDYTFNNSNYTNNAPYLAVIALGNIYVQPGVSQISGLFVAQPTGGAANGIFSTCSNGVNNDSPATPADELGACNSQLTVNGSVIAEHVYLTRSSGTLYPATSGLPAETFNFSPSVEIGTPALKSTSSPNGVPGTLNDLTNLPPVF